MHAPTVRDCPDSVRARCRPLYHATTLGGRRGRSALMLYRGLSPEFRAAPERLGCQRRGFLWIT
jgi:hypothetical protein